MAKILLLVLTGVIGSAVCCVVVALSGAGGLVTVLTAGTEHGVDWGPGDTGGEPGAGPPIRVGEGQPGNCPTGSTGTAGGTDFVWPTPSTWLSGWSFNPSSHPGIDIGLSIGTPVKSSEGGWVVFSGWSTVGYGLAVVINHGNGWWTRYAHLSEISVVCGQQVAQGQLLGLGGSTGRSTGPHLHFELSGPTGRIDPVPVLRAP